MSCPHSTRGLSSQCSMCLQATPRIVRIHDGIITVDDHAERPNDEPVPPQVVSARRRGQNARKR